MNTLKQSDRTHHQPELVAARSYDSGGDETLNFDFTAIYFDSPQRRRRRCVCLFSRQISWSKDFTAIYFDSVSTGEDVSVFLADKSPGPRLSLNRSQ